LLKIDYNNVYIVIGVVYFMEMLEDVADVDGMSLRCKGWCHDFTSETVYHSDIPSVDYFE